MHFYVADKQSDAIDLSGLCCHAAPPPPPPPPTPPPPPYVPAPPANSVDYGILCDVADPVQASMLIYSYFGLGYNGDELLANMAGEPVLLQVPSPGGALAINYAMACRSMHFWTPRHAFVADKQRDPIDLAGLCATQLLLPPRLPIPMCLRLQPTAQTTASCATLPTRQRHQYCYTRTMG
jgi:hypothetical protein